MRSVFAVWRWPVASWTRRPPKRTEQKWAEEAEIVVNCPSQGPDLAVSPVTLTDEGVRATQKASVLDIRVSSWAERHKNYVLFPLQ